MKAWKRTRKRRSILRSVGSVPAIGTFGTIGTRNVRANEENEFVGVAYDPVTGDKISDITATVARSPNHLHGNLRFKDGTGIEGFPSDAVLPIRGDGPIATGSLPNAASEHAQVSEFVQHDDKQFALNGKPLKTSITSVESGDISGAVRRVGNLGDEIAFRIGSDGVDDGAAGTQSSTDTKSRVEDMALFSVEVD